MVSGLPETCFTLNGHGIAMQIKRGVSGTFPSGLGAQTQEAVDLANKLTGVTKAQATAMLVGAMHGWDAPGANPENYDEDGKWRGGRKYQNPATKADGDKPELPKMALPKGYVALAVYKNQHVLAKSENPETPQPFVVWHLDQDGDTWGGQYFKDEIKAEICFARSCFKWFPLVPHECEGCAN